MDNILIGKNAIDFLKQASVMSPDDIAKLAKKIKNIVYKNLK